MGTTDSGKTLSVDPSILVASRLVVGAAGAGKSRFLIGLILQLLERLSGLSHLNGAGVESEIVDPNDETYDLLRLALAALWLQTSAWGRDELASRIRVIDWTRDWITPSAPFMLGRILIEKQFPMNLHFTSKLFRDEPFRRRIVSGIVDPDVREHPKD